MSKIRSFLGWFLLVCFAFAGLGVISPQTVSAQPSSAAQNQVVIYLFWGDGCSHCAVAKPFLSELAQRYPHVELRAYEVWYVAENQELFTQMAAAYGFEPSGVPTILIGDRYWVGYNDTIAQEIEAMVQSCESNACPDRGVGIIPGVESYTSEEPVTATEQAEDPSSSSQPVILTLPLLGQ
ncbi:MAG: glutaredoxin family protein, partial [Chloroflexi bacterium]|nr:glutaredoxin family protein [Chloroflexota bacterium]